LPTKEAPFNEDGNMVSYPNEPHPGHKRCPWHTKMRTVEPFEAEMRVTGFERGQSAARVTLQDIATGVSYPLFLADLLPILQEPTREAPELRIRGTWAVSKRGRNYGIKRVAQ
jgi:hypothetical protein